MLIENPLKGDYAATAKTRLQAVAPQVSQSRSSPYSYNRHQADFGIERHLQRIDS
jgi:hypothetical protein